MINKLKKGFTLMELLVVVSIMGILIALGTVSYTTAQKKGRNARRNGDIKAMQNALEQYYALNTNYGDTGVSTNCTEQLVAGGMLEVPTDPKNGDSYFANCPTTGTDFCLCAYLESSTEPKSTDAECSEASAPAGYGYYCLINQQ